MLSDMYMRESSEDTNIPYKSEKSKKRDFLVEAELENSQARRTTKGSRGFG